MTAPLRLATTVVLLRQGARGPEVFLVKRSQRMAFMPSAWVFPGGRVEASDGALGAPQVTGGEWVAGRLAIPSEAAVAMLVAGVRETFEEVGVWLGTGRLPQSARAPLAAGEVSLASLLQAHGATIDLDVLSPWAWWVTPKQERRRYDTRFVVAVTAEDGAHDQTENVDSAWVRPADAMAQADAGERWMAPPTWWTLRELVGFDQVQDVLASAKTREIARIEPVLRLDAPVREVLLPGAAEHPDPAIRGLPTRIRLDDGKWWSDERQ